MTLSLDWGWLKRLAQQGHKPQSRQVGNSVFADVMPMGHASRRKKLPCTLEI
jgi:hypothetical protein